MKMKAKEITVSHSLKKSVNFQSVGGMVSVTFTDIKDLKEMKKFVKEECRDMCDSDAEKWLQEGRK